MEKMSDHFYKYLFDYSHEGILITSPNGRIHKANPAACRMFQRTEEEIILGGRSLLVDENDPKVIKAIKERQKTGSYQTEISFRKKDGTTFIGQINSTIFVEGDFHYTILIVRDLTIEHKEKLILEKEKKYKEYLAHHDYLTKTWNRRGFIHQFKKALKKHDQSDVFYLFLIDMDYFKEINDALGHLQGDYYLKKFSSKMKSMVYKDSIFARYGGDEFIYYVPNLGSNEIEKVANKIMRYIDSIKIPTEKKIHVTVSIGVAEIKIKDNLSIDQMISKADKAMYEAKKKRNAYHIL